MKGDNMFTDEEKAKEILSKMHDYNDIEGKQTDYQVFKDLADIYNTRDSTGKLIVSNLPRRKLNFEKAVIEYLRSEGFIIIQNIGGLRNENRG